MGGNMRRDEGRNETSCSESSYDSSSSDERKRYNSRKRVINVRNGNATPIGQIELDPDAFRGVMNPENSVTSVIRGNNSRQEPGCEDEEVGGITPGDRYDPNDATLRDQTDNLQRKKEHRKNRKNCKSKRKSRKVTKRSHWHDMYTAFLATEPGIDFQDQGTKGVTYTCQTKNSLHADY